MSRLADVTIGSLKGAKVRRAVTAVPPSAPIPEQPVQTPTQETSTDLQWFQRIPEQILRPFWQVDLIPDLIYLLQFEGVQATIKEAYPIPQPPPGQSDIALPSPPDPQIAVNRKRRSNVETAFRTDGVRGAVLEMLFPGRDPSGEELTAAASSRADLTRTIYERGVERLTALMQAADPADPTSLIFQHSSQDVHRATQAVQIELIKNEPEVEERSTIQCACGSRKIRTTFVQTRGGDEAQTIFAQCVACKSFWKQSAA